MASALMFDLDRFLGSPPVLTRQRVYELLPQKHEFMQLDAVVHVDRKQGHSVAYRDVSDDEWWCRGHIPRSPILPGVLMLEAAAQLAALTECYLEPGFKGFVGYGGVDACKFRQIVKPPCRLWILSRRLEVRSRRIVCSTQGVVDGTLVFEANVTGLVVPV